MMASALVVNGAKGTSFNSFSHLVYITGRRAEPLEESAAKLNAIRPGSTIAYAVFHSCANDKCPIRCDIERRTGPSSQNSL